MTFLNLSEKLEPNHSAAGDCSYLATPEQVIRCGMIEKYQIKRYKTFKKKWEKVIPGMTIDEASDIMGFEFNLDSENKAGRMVYSHHTSDYLPFYVVVDRETGLIVRRHEIVALNQVIGT